MSSAACARLASRTSFKDYVATAREFTNGTFNVPRSCQGDVCNALYGFGNSDIDGVGMLAGYLLTNILGLVLAITLPLLKRYASSLQSRNIILAGFESYYDCAVLLSFSIQIATTIMLARMDYGISANGMGDSTAKESWAVSMVTILPLMYGVFVPKTYRASDSQVSPTGTPLRDAGSEKNEGSLFDETDQENLRFLLFILCWILSIYQFFSKMVESFSPSQIGNEKDAIISLKDWNRLTAPCFTNVKALSGTEITVIDVFGIFGFVFICIFTLARLTLVGLGRNFPESTILQIVQSLQQRQILIRATHVVLIVLVPILGLSQFWTIFRLRELQQQMSQASGDSYVGNDWTFGQVIALTVFMPVPVRCGSEWVNKRRGRAALDQ